MFGRRGGRSAKKDAVVWLLGRDHPGADRSLKWDDIFGNLSDPDVLIVDLTGLTEDILQRIDKGNLDEACRSIKDKILYGGTIVVITQPKFSISPGRLLTGRPPSMYLRATVDPYIYSNYHILPIYVDTTPVPPGFEIRACDGHCFKEYIDAVKRYNFLISTIYSRIPPGPAGANPDSLCPTPEWDITDNSGRLLGLALAPPIPDYRNRRQGDPCSGHLVLLPPPTEQIDEAIERILSVYKTRPSAEAPPAWAEQISLGPASGHKAQRAKLEAARAKIQVEIDDLTLQIDRIQAHRRLLYSDGPELEDAVVEAFRTLGFDDIERRGNADEEDAAFGMGGSGSARYSRCVIEAKGAGKGVQMRHILQCGRWAERRAAAEGRPSKGVFVPNQHRLKPYPESREIRMRIEPNQLEHARLKDICIIPSCALFEAVKQALEGATPDRARIAGTAGVLKDIR